MFYILTSIPVDYKVLSYPKVIDMLLPINVRKGLSQFIPINNLKTLFHHEQYEVYLPTCSISKTCLLPKIFSMFFISTINHYNCLPNFNFLFI